MLIFEVEETEQDLVVKRYLKAYAKMKALRFWGTYIAYTPLHKADDCVVCMSAPKNALLLPCKHMAMCGECTKKVSCPKTNSGQCPLCRANIMEVVYDILL
jgi:hypothetical protein